MMSVNLHRLLRRRILICFDLIFIDKAAISWYSDSRKWLAESEGIIGGALVSKKEEATKEDLMTVIKILEETGIRYWIDGGWGVDVLAGEQTRTHRDIDIDFDVQQTGKLLKILADYGYEVDTDWAPVRIELYSKKMGYLDIHPFIIYEDGTSKQADLEGGWYVFEADYFGSAVFEGKTIPCISVKGQKVFHTGYELRDVDKHDMELIERLLGEVPSLKN